jgi:hypothetical protein
MTMQTALVETQGVLELENKYDINIKYNASIEKYC